MQNEKVVLITGAAKRVGAIIARTLHAQGMRIAIHYRASANDAKQLCTELNNKRADSCITIQADLQDTGSLSTIIKTVIDTWQRLDVLINNASSFYPTPIGTATEQHWEDLFSSNLKAPFFLAQTAAPFLTQTQGCIINIVDTQAFHALKAYPIYSIAKAGLLALTKSLAKELAPAVRVNAIAPGVVQWPDDEENGLDQTTRDKIIARTLLKRTGTPQDIANAALFLVQSANYMTGQTLVIDGGRSLTQ
jgi:pteridine reductase